MAKRAARPRIKKPSKAGERTFRLLRVGDWFLLHGILHQKLTNLNTSNAYQAGDFKNSKYVHVKQDEIVDKTYPPMHITIVKSWPIVIHKDGTWNEYWPKDEN